MYMKYMEFMINYRYALPVYLFIFLHNHTKLPKWVINWDQSTNIWFRN